MRNHKNPLKIFNKWIFRMPETKPVSVHKRAAIQLSMGFLVMLIIAVVIFILSLVFLSDFFKQATDLKTGLDKQTGGQIEKLLSGNARVAIPLETKNTKAGDPVQFGIGIKNTDTSSPLKDNFKVELFNLGKFIPADQPDISKTVTCGDETCSVDYTMGSYNPGDPAVEYVIGRNGAAQIDVNRDDVMVIAVLPYGNAPRGHYIFNVEICAGSSAPSSCNSNPTDLYDGTIHKIHVIVG